MSKTIEAKLENLQHIIRLHGYSYDSRKHEFDIDLIGLLDSLVKELKEHKIRINELEGTVRYLKIRS